MCVRMRVLHVVWRAGVMHHSHLNLFDLPCRTQGLPSMPELKLKYYHLMIRYYSYYNNYLEMTRCYRAVYEEEGVQADPARWTPVRVPLHHHSHHHSVQLPTRTARGKGGGRL